MEYTVDIKKINELLGGKLNRCPVCGSVGSFSVSDKIFQLTEYKGDEIILAGGTAIAPMVVVVCNKCGNSIFLNALITGLMIPKNSNSGEEDKK